MINKQIPLALRFPEQIHLNNFVVGDNAAVIAKLSALIENPSSTSMMIWGERGVGKSHLLQGAYCRTIEKGNRAAYIPFNQRDEWTPAILDDLECVEYVFIDDLHKICNSREWETALFHLYNRTLESSTQLVFASEKNPSSLSFMLPDLQSRLNWGWVFRLQALDDGDKCQVLMRRAADKGLTLDNKTSDYLIRHGRRDLPFLIDFLEKCDHIALAEQRRLTLPFIRAVLAEETTDSR